MQVLRNGLNLLREVGRKAGPYLLLELFLPGGTLCALLLFLAQRRYPQAALRARGVVKALMRTLAGACEAGPWGAAGLGVTVDSIPRPSTSIRSQR